MHKYLKAIGFTNLKKERDIKEILIQTEEQFDYRELISRDEECDFCEFKRTYADRTGIAVYGERDKLGMFEREYYTPYFEGTGITSYADIFIERRIEKQMYIGVCEDVRVGASIIFHIQNPIECLEEEQEGGVRGEGASVTLAGLGASGTILFPVLKDEKQERTQREEEYNRKMLISAAKSGDERAMESLTLEEIDMYSKVSRRLITEDVFTIVETYFMPYGVECDQYSIMGEILSLQTTQNEVTSELIYIMKLNVNELIFDVCIPAKALMGEPAVGRRFKGVIWLQGKINF